MIKKCTIADFVQELQVVIFITNFFSNMCIGKEGLDLGFYYDIHVDVDVFLYNACKILGGWTSDSKWCSFHEKFGYAVDLFRAFCSVFVRIYLNLTISCFEDILSKVAVIDKNKILTQILKHAEIFLRKFWTETNMKIFHEFFYLFDELNRSFCYKNDKVKPKFGPYFAP